MIMSVEFLASNEVKCRCHPPMNCTVPKWVKFNFVKVRDTLLNCGLSPAGRRPLVCIDECQVKIKMSLQRCDDDVQLKVLDELFGWTGFRESYGNSTWRWLVAALGPKYVKCFAASSLIGFLLYFRFLLSSASLSEESLCRVCGENKNISLSVI